MKPTGILPLLVALGMCSVTLAGNLIVNGDFEEHSYSGSYREFLSAGSAGLDHWSIDSGDIDLYYNEPKTIPPNGTGSWLDMNGDHPGGISQSFPTYPGARYTVTFDMGGNPDRFYPPAIKTLQVSASGQSAQFTCDTQSFTNWNWSSKSWTFTANSATTSLSFASLSGSGWNRAGPTLDNVAVTQRCPAPPPDPSPPLPGARTHAFICGVNWAPSPFEAILGWKGSRGGDNAQRFYNALPSNTNWGAMTLHIMNQYVPDPESNVLSALGEVVRQVPPGDTFIFYLSSHGGPLTWAGEDQNEAVGVMSAVNTDDEGVSLGGLVPSCPGTGPNEILEDDELYQFLKDSAPKGWDQVNKIFVLDSCHSGGFWGGQDSGDLERFVPRGRTALLAAAGEGSNAGFNRRTGESYFTSALVEGFSTDPVSGRPRADRNGDSMVTAWELGSFATSQAGGVHFFGADVGLLDFDPPPDSGGSFLFDPVFMLDEAGQDMFVVVPVPEPATVLLLALGGLVVIRRRRK